MAFTVFSNRGAELDVVDVNGTTRDMTAFWVGGHPEMSNDAVEVTSIADAAKRNILGLQDAALRFSFLYDDVGTTGSWSVLSGRLGETTLRNIVWFPSGTAAGKPQITIPCRLQSLTPSGGVGERGMLDAVFVVDGTRTVGTV